MNKIIHCEIPVKNIESSKEFYSKTFGWKFEKVEGQDYWFINTGNKEISTGMEPMMTSNYPVSYVLVDSIDKTLEEIIKNGGKIFEPKTKFGKTTYWAICTDTSGNHIGLLEKIK